MDKRTTHCLFHILVVSLAVLGFSFPQIAAADGFDVQQFQPMPNIQGNFFDTASADVAPHLGWSGMVLFNYNNDPLVRRDEDDEAIESLIEHQGTAHLLLSIGIIERVELGVDLPLVVMQSGAQHDAPALSPGDGGFAIGDLRLVPKVQLFSTRDHVEENGVAMALLVDSHLPTGNSDVLQGGDFRIGPRLAFDAVVGGPRIGLNVGYLYRDEEAVENLAVRDTLSWNVGIEVPVIDELRLTGEVFGRLTPGADEIRRVESPTEALAGVKFVHNGLQIVGGGGAGLINGYGTPDARAFVGVGWATPHPPAEEPEVTPEPEPEPEPECRPETVAEQCPDVPASSCEDGALRTYTAACEEGECAYHSSDEPCGEGTRCEEDDGVAACVAIPDCEADGDCTDEPDPTCIDDVLTTHAGQCVDGSCHYEPVETPCDEEQECGLSAGIPACVEATDLVEVDEERDRIDISEVVYFEVNADDVAGRSYNLLNQVATVLTNHPELVLIRIEGHTDSTGARDYNVDLSQRRAESVRQYLIDQGVDSDRLRAVGLGPDEPVADNDTESGRAENRRVEFHIEQRD